MSLCVSFKVDVRCFGGLNVFEVNEDEDMFCFHTCERHGQLTLEVLLHTSVEVVEQVPDDWLFGGKHTGMSLLFGPSGLMSSAVSISTSSK